jgi:hypothetical protein
MSKIEIVQNMGLEFHFSQTLYRKSIVIALGKKERTSRLQKLLSSWIKKKKCT